jgi:hypothetical protein
VRTRSRYHDVRMRPVLLALLTFIAFGSSSCGPTAPSPTPQLANCSKPVVRVQTRRVFAVVSTSEEYDECTNMGGEHYLFEGEVAGKHVLLHGGRHGESLGLFCREDDCKHPGDAVTPRWFVAEVESKANIAVAPLRSVDRDDSWRTPYFCGEFMPELDGLVVALVPAADRADAEALRATFATTEPTASHGLGASPAACVAIEFPGRGTCSPPNP